MIKFIFVLILISFCYLQVSLAQETHKKPDLVGIIATYEEALNDGNTSQILSLFSEDAVLVLQGAPTCERKEAIEKFYLQIFQRIDFDLKFNIAETVLLSPDWAFIRTSTHTKTSLNKSEEAHEIFILNKAPTGVWKIARYAGSSSL